MRFGSVCSGIEAASVAWDHLGWRADWFAEIEAFPSSVLAHHWPNVQNVGNMLTLPDVAGTICRDCSANQPLNPSNKVWTYDTQHRFTNQGNARSRR